MLVRADDIIFQNKVAIAFCTLAFQARKLLKETSFATEYERFGPNESSRPMEKELAQQQRQSRTQPTAATTTTTTKRETSRQVVLGVTSGGDGSMGGNRSGSTSSSVGWMEEGGSGTVKTPTTPRQPSKRDSGYHTDYSPATFTSPQSHPATHFTFDPQDTLLSATSEEGSPLRQGSPLGVGSPLGSSSAPLLPRSSLTLSPGWQPQRVLPSVDSDDEDNDDAFVSDNVTDGATSHRPGSVMTHASSVGQHGALTLTPRGQLSATDLDEPDGLVGDRLAALRLGGGETSEGRRRNVARSGFSPRHSRLRGVRRVVEDSDGDSCNDEKEEEEGEGVARTDYHHASLSLVRLPGGERIRPLLARTIATQTPHLHCQLIDQILACPQDFPQCARGSAVRRLRYYSEGEESVGASALACGPLPDIVPVTHGHRERSLSAPDLEALQRQRVAAREVGRELRRISDEFVRSHEAMRGNPHGALAALHAELNGVAAFFLTGVRRFLYRGFAGYFRHVFHWTRQALASAEQPPDSSVDDQR